MNIIAHIPFLKKLNTEMADVTRAKKRDYSWKGLQIEFLEFVIMINPLCSKYE